MDSLDLLIANVFGQLGEIFENANRRHFWLYILTGFLLAIVAHRFNGDKRKFTEVMFERETWLGRSALMDYLIFFLNPIIMFVLFESLFENAAVSMIESMRDFVYGSGPAITEFYKAHPTIFVVFCTVIVFLADDFFRFFGHYLQHRIPYIWEFHKVHHSAEKLNFATAQRFHPLDTAFFVIVRMPVMCLIYALIYGFAGTTNNDKLFFQFATANVLLVAFNLFGGTYRHSPAWISFGPFFSRLFISPAMHQIHHSENPEHFDKNFGGSLSIWDSLFGTLYVPEKFEQIKYGIGPETEEFQDLRGVYVLPIVNFVNLLTGVKREDDPQASVEASQDAE